MRARRDATCRSAPRSADCSSATRSSANRSAATVRSWCSSRPTSPASSSPTRALHGLELRLGLLRAGGGLLDADRQPRDGSRRSTRRGCAWCRPDPPAAPGLRGGRPRHGRPRGARARLRPPAAPARPTRRARPPAVSRDCVSSVSSSCSCAATFSASASSASGSAPVDASTSASRCWARSLAMRTVALTRSASADSRNHVCCAASARPESPDTADSCVASSIVASSSRAASSSCSRRSARLGLVGVVELGLPGDQVVGGQPQPRIAQVGLDGLGPAGHFGLPAERFELTAQLGGQVGEPVQVGRHRVELADRLFLALAVLEHARRLLDEGATVLGARFQDLGELALPDDHVHLTADARVAQQFLHVHQTATAAVDFVFAGAIAEHSAGDRHLGVFDRQRVVRVVDRDGDLGAAERGPRRSAGEDDVFHLAAAQGLGPLLAHHPTQRVDHVRLARPVGADDARDPGSKRRVVGEAKDLKPFSVRLLRCMTCHNTGESGPICSTGPVKAYFSTNPSNDSPASVQSATTASTCPGCRRPAKGPEVARHAGRGPCATTCTRPSGVLAANRSSRAPGRGLGSTNGSPLPAPGRAPRPRAGRQARPTSTDPGRVTINVTSVPDFTVRPTVQTLSTVRLRSSAAWSPRLRSDSTGRPRAAPR